MNAYYSLKSENKYKKAEIDEAAKGHAMKNWSICSWTGIIVHVWEARAQPAPVTRPLSLSFTIILYLSLFFFLPCVYCTGLQALL